MNSAPIRAATLADIHAIAVFQTACWREVYRGLVPQAYLDGVSVADRETRWSERLATGARSIALAEFDTSIVAVVSVLRQTPIPPGRHRPGRFRYRRAGTALRASLARRTSDC